MTLSHNHQHVNRELQLMRTTTSSNFQTLKLRYLRCLHRPTQINTQFFRESQELSRAQRPLPVMLFNSAARVCFFVRTTVMPSEITKKISHHLLPARTLTVLYPASRPMYPIRKRAALGARTSTITHPSGGPTRTMVTTHRYKNQSAVKNKIE